MKAKYKPGDIIRSLDELSKEKLVYHNHKILHKGWFQSWQIRLAEAYIRVGAIRKAVRLTNGEYFKEKSDEQLMGYILSKEIICDYCPLEEQAKGVHCYGGVVHICEGSGCEDALEAWKKEEVV